MFSGVGRSMSPRWNGYTVWPSALHAFASAETANAVSVPRRLMRSATGLVFGVLMPLTP